MLDKSFSVMTRRSVSQRQDKGIALIESMVALFIFAVGALGLAALQMTTLKQGDDSAAIVDLNSECTIAIRRTMANNNPQSSILSIN